MKHYLSLLLLFIATHSVAQTNKATFRYFEYKGNDTGLRQKFDPSKEYRNPILPGFYPDPSVCRRGDDFFLVNSTFSYFPGIPIFHSKDLVHWKQIGHVLDRPSQLKLDGLGLSSGIYAPAISYNQQNKTFYLVCTVVGGMGNFVVKSTDPFKGWGDPIRLPEINGIDPSLFFDDNGKAYLVHNGIPDGPPRWNGHRAIHLREYSPETDKIVGKDLIVVDGGVDPATRPVWIEGPHLYKINGRYLLMAAEGGTSEGHSEVIFSSDKVDGPYTPAGKNPILTQRDLPENRPDKVTSTGHADLVQAPSGEWYAVFLGCRPYRDDLYNTGRETFMLPVTWKDGFPVILEKGKNVPLVVSTKELQPNGQELTGNFTWRDNFRASGLDPRWIMLRTPRETWWEMAGDGIRLATLPRSLGQLVNPAFLACRQQHMSFEVSTMLDFTPHSDKELAGMAYFQNDKNYFVIGKTMKDGKTVVLVQGVTEGVARIISTRELTGRMAKKGLNICVRVDKETASFYYASERGKRILLSGNVDVTNLSTSKAKGFVGSVVGMYATSSGN